MREYEVKVGGITHTMQLSEHDVKRYGATERKAPAAPVRKAPAKKKATDTGDGSDD